VGENIEVSVIIPVYNAESRLRSAIDSVLAQGVALEVIAVDDASCDASLDILREYEREVPNMVTPWYGDFARFTCNEGNNIVNYVERFNADSSTATGSLRNEGIGPFEALYCYVYGGRASVENVHASGRKVQAWIEGWGETRAYLLYIDTSVTDEFTGAVKELANYWTWAWSGPKSDADITGGKKLIYTGIEMDLAAIDDFAKLGETNPMFAALDEICKRHNGLWNAEAEKYLLANAKAI